MTLHRRDVVLGSLGLLAIPASGKGYVDPLNRPARKSPLAGKRMLLDVTAAGARLVVVGHRGHVLWSDDQGNNWTQADVPVSSDLTAVVFPTPAKGWAVGHDGVVLRSTDAAKTWTKQLDGFAAEKLQREFYQQLAAQDAEAGRRALRELDLNYRDGAALPWLGVGFEDERNGFVVGAFGLILRTETAGERWLPWAHRIDNPEGLHLNAVRVIEGRTWIASERGILFLLDPRTQRFNAVRTGYNGTFLGVIGRGDLLLAYGLGGHAWRSDNAGKSWVAVKTGLGSTLNGGTVLLDGRLALVSQSGQVVASADGGATFAPVPGAVPTLLSSIAGLSGGRIALVGLSGVQVITLR